MYNVVRFYKDAGIRRRVILEAVTLDEAQRHCSDPETSSSTATGKVARARTRRVGDWFDGYEERVPIIRRRRRAEYGRCY